MDGWESPSWLGMLCLKGQGALLLKVERSGFQSRCGVWEKGQSRESMDEKMYLGQEHMSLLNGTVAISSI